MKKILQNCFPNPLPSSLFFQTSNAQSVTKTRSGEVPKGWHTMDKDKDGQYGISLEKTYNSFNQKSLKANKLLLL